MKVLVTGGTGLVGSSIKELISTKNENEYVFIPANWMHWVFTEPFNVSMNYLISSIQMILINYSQPSSRI